MENYIEIKTPVPFQDPELAHIYNLSSTQKRPLEFSKNLPGLALEYIDLKELNRPNRRSIKNGKIKDYYYDLRMGIVTITYQLEGARKFVSVVSSYSTGDTYLSRRTGLIELGKGSAEFIADDPQTIFVCISWKIKRASVWQYVKYIWRQVSSKFRGLR